MVNAHTEQRPRFGAVKGPHGESIPVRFEPTEDPLVFEALTLDFEPVLMLSSEHLYIDVLGPGQSVLIRVVDGRDR